MMKFISVKAIVFFTWFQTIILQGMVTMGWIQDGYFGEASTVSAGIGYFVICIEMAAVSIWHHNIFGHDMYKVGATSTNLARGMRDVLLAKDVIADMRTVLQKHKKGTNPVHIRAAGAEQLGQLKRDPDVPEMVETEAPTVFYGESRNGPIPLDARPESTTSTRFKKEQAEWGQDMLSKDARQDAKLMSWRAKDTDDAAASSAAANKFSIGESDDENDNASDGGSDADGTQMAELGAQVLPIDQKRV